MKKWVLLAIGLLAFAFSHAQEIYIINNENELKILNVSNFSVSDVLSVDSNTYGTMLDIAFNPQGRLFATTSFNTIIEIDLSTQQITTLFTFPAGGSYPGLTANAANELLTSKFLNLELYSYNIDTQAFTLVETNISTPGDFTHFKGNLVYPSFFNDFIKAYDGTTITNVGCSVPLLFGIANVFEDCETNTIYAFDEDAKVYLYTLGQAEFEEVADLWSITGPIFGAATVTEYLASACTLVALDEVECGVLSVDDYNPLGIRILKNPIRDRVELFADRSIDGLKYALFDIRGVEVQKGGLDNTQIEVSGLTAGWYVLKLNDHNGRLVFTEKLILR